MRTLAGDSARIAPGEPVTLLHVWATWCGPCEKEFPEIEALQKEFGPRGLRIVAVSVDEGDDGPVVNFVKRKGATFEIGRDPAGFGPPSLPGHWCTGELPDLVGRPAPGAAVRRDP